MNVEMLLGLPDVPGSLLRAIEPVSNSGGNIQSIVHSRGGKGDVEVKLIFKVRDEKSLDAIRKKLKANKVRVLDVVLEGRHYYSKKSVDFALIGHVIDADIQDTIDRLNKVGLVSTVDVEMTDPDTESTVFMKADVDAKDTGKLAKELEAISEEKGFLLISALK